jgi:beta-galactosidase/beta-glucuronidase
LKLAAKILFIIFLTNTILLAEDWERITNLRGYWKFSIGDDLDWAKNSFDDSDWERIRVPSTWEDQGFHGYNGYAWYRKKFTLDLSNINSTIYLQMGFIDDADEVYLNGNLVGKSGGFPPSFETAYNAFRKYPIAKELLNEFEENVIAVRVYDSQLGGGIVSGDIGLYTKFYDIDKFMSLEGRWKFRIKDNKEWKNENYDDSDWDDILVPGIWEHQGYEDYDGFAWYRKTFMVPANIKDEKLVVLLGKIDDIDEAYLNGVKIGSTGEMYDDEFYIYIDQEWQEFRGYYIPKNILKQGKNVLAVRVYDGYQGGGIHEGPIGIVEQDEYVKFWRSKKKRNIWEIIFGDN